MIYLMYGKTAQERGPFPEIVSTDTPHIESIGFFERAMADFIFYFEGDKTIYYKNRYFDYKKQYTKEERVVIALKAVPL